MLDESPMNEIKKSLAHLKNVILIPFRLGIIICYYKTPPLTIKLCLIYQVKTMSLARHHDNSAVKSPA